MKQVTRFQQFRITHPVARVHCAVAGFVLILLCRELWLVAIVSMIALLSAVTAGWKAGGGPPWWMLILTAVVTVIAFSVQMYPHWQWVSDGWTRGLPVAARLIGWIAIGVWTIAGLPVVRLAKAMERLLYPVKRIIPGSHQFGLTVSIALSSWGWLRQEADRTKLALAARGVQFSGSLYNRVHTAQSLLFLMIAQALRRADALTVALYCRGWRENSPITKAQPIPRLQFAAVLASWLLVVVAGAWRWLR